MPKLHISYPFIILTSVLLALDTDGLLLLAWIAIILHEAGHIVCIALLRCKVEAVRVGLGGMYVEYSAGRQTSYVQDALIAFAGPLANILSLIPLTIAARANSNFHLHFLIGASLIIAVFNLLPAMPTDGGRILLALASTSLGAQRGAALTQLSTFATGTAMAATGLWLMLETRGNFMLFASALVILSGLFGKKLYRTT